MVALVVENPGLGNFSEINPSKSHFANKFASQAQTL